MHNTITSLKPGGILFKIFNDCKFDDRWRYKPCTSSKCLGLCALYEHWLCEYSVNIFFNRTVTIEYLYCLTLWSGTPSRRKNRFITSLDMLRGVFVYTCTSQRAGVSVFQGYIYQWKSCNLVRATPYYYSKNYKKLHT